MFFSITTDYGYLITVQMIKCTNEMRTKTLQRIVMQTNEERHMDERIEK